MPIFQTSSKIIIFTNECFCPKWFIFVRKFLVPKKKTLNSLPKILVTKISISLAIIIKELVSATIFIISSGKIIFNDKILIRP